MSYVKVEKEIIDEVKRVYPGRVEDFVVKAIRLKLKMLRNGVEEP